MSFSQREGEFSEAPLGGEHLAGGLFGVDVGTGSAIRYQANRIELATFQAAAGDANGDRSFDQLDVVQLLIEDQYLSGEPADWTAGDFDHDGFFTQLDLVAALQAGHYLQGASASVSSGHKTGMGPQVQSIALLEDDPLDNGVCRNGNRG